MSRRPLRVLFVEDREADATLLLLELRRGGFDVTHRRVETAEGLNDALDEGGWDVLISDYSMPVFSAPVALQIIADRGVDVPILIVSGTVNEEIAVDCMRAGAHDFMSKSRLARLVPAIERELRDAAVRAEQRKLQDQLMISDRMASMGTLAAGVAHEINNPLASVIVNLDLALRDVTDKAEQAGLGSELAELREELVDARSAADRIRNLVRDLRIFSRPEDDVSVPVDLPRVLESTLRMAKTEVRHRARLVQEFSPVPQVQGNESRLGQVFLNLVVNAAQAIPEGHAEANELRVRTLTDGAGRAVVEVTDTGAGMPPEVVARLFTPFFTTKPPGVGTGLGLSICHRIVSGMGGRIDVQSEPGAGSTFRVTLPPLRSAAPRVVSAAASVVPATARGRVLVIDDELLVNRAVRRALEGEHDVTTLTHAAEALMLIEAGARFDVILCDLMMPDMSGMEFHDRARQLDARLAADIVFLTAGAFTPDARAFLAAVPNQRVEKPFDPLRLRSLVNGRVAR